LDQVPVIFLTALNDETDEETGLGLGAVDFITKPFKLQLVRNRIRNQLELKHLQDRLRDQAREQEALVAERTRQLSEALARLKAQDAVKALYIRILAKEIQGPTNGILGITQLALRSIEDGDKRARWEGVLAENQDRLEATLDQYQRLSRAADPGNPMPVQVVRLNEAVKVAAASVGSRGLRFPAPSSVPIFVTAHPATLTECLTTLFQLAAYFCTDASRANLEVLPGPCTVEVRLTVPASALVPVPDDALGAWVGVDQFAPALDELGLEVPLCAVLLERMGSPCTVRPRDGVTQFAVTLKTYNPGVHP
jgi:signal transduction histidine kinase